MMNISFNTDNDCFLEDMQTSIENIFDKIVNKVIAGEREDKIIDLNGNNVGQWSLSE